LIELDTEELHIQIRRDESEVAAARRRLEIGPTLNTELLNAKDELALREELFKSGSIGAIELERHRRTVAQIEQRIELERVNLAQQVAALESALALNRHKLTLMTIVSPIDGVISEVNAGAGDLVNPGSPIARITSNERIVEARVSEENFAGVRVGQRATVRFLQHGGMLYNASVAKILPEADPQTQRYRVHIDVVIEPEKLVPGITGEASITLEERPNALVVPRTALLGNSVFVVADGRVERRRVEVGYRALNAVEILSGIAEGDLVVVEDLDRLRDGDRVTARRRANDDVF
jgi:RND family efflux transporter MFP subunit